MHEFIKQGTKYPFMATAKYWIAATGMAVLISFILLFTKGLNLGIDFKGGTKLIVAFPESVGASREAVEQVMQDTIKEKTGKSDIGQIEVQDFNVGTTDKEGKAYTKFQIYTELTTLLDASRAEELTKALEAALAAKAPAAKIERAEETDKFLITLKDVAPIAETKALIAASLAKFGFAHAEVTCDEEQSIDMEFYKEYNLSVVERTKDGVAIADDDYSNRKAEHDKVKAEALLKRKDKSYTASLEQLQSDAEAALVAKFGKDVVVESATSVSASVGSDLFSQGMLALIYCIVGILIYVGLRFDFRYSPGVVVALIHDAVFSLGFFCLFGLQFTLPIISAVLTIIGFSVNDTVVVYDRIRENMGKLKGMPIREIIDRSINETLSRTILTSLTAILSVLPLIFLGGGFIRDFAIALVVGFTVGTYSSIFIAAPLVILIDEWQHERRSRTGSSSPAAATGA